MIRTSWPHLRGVLVALHVVAVLGMSVPSPEGMSEGLLRREQARLGPWQAALAQVGVPRETTAALVLHGGQALERVEDGAERLFAPYVRVCGVGQNWRMFATSPPRGQRVEMWISEAGTWRPLFVPLDPDARWRAELWEHGRVRGALRSLTSASTRQWWRALAESAARRAAQDFPKADTFRLQYVPVRFPTPEAMADGEGVVSGPPDGLVEVALAPLRRPE